MKSELYQQEKRRGRELEGNVSALEYIIAYAKKNAVETNIASVQTEAKGAAGYQGDRAGVKYDDWYCHRCDYEVFAKWKECPKCGRLRTRSGA